MKAGPLSDAYEASQAQSSSISNSDPWNTSSRHQGIQAASIPSAFAPAYESGQQQTEEREGGAGEEMGFGERGMDAGSGAGWAMGEQKRVEVSGRDELGGRLLLTHKVYFVKSENGVVERRFRDFVYLQDVLVKRYPFRLLPSLPPKRLSVAGKYLIAGDVFLERQSFPPCVSSPQSDVSQRRTTKIPRAIPQHRNQPSDFTKRPPFPHIPLTPVLLRLLHHFQLHPHDRRSPHQNSLPLRNRSHPFRPRYETRPTSSSTYSYDRSLESNLSDVRAYSHEPTEAIHGFFENQVGNGNRRGS